MAWLFPLLVWSLILPGWVAFDWFCRPALKRAFGGGSRLMVATAVWYAPAWLTVLIVMAPEGEGLFGSLLWRFPLALAVGVLCAVAVKRAPLTASLYRDYDAAQRQANGWTG